LNGSSQTTLSTPLPCSGRLAAIDYGTVRLGIAITDPDQRLASPLENYTRRNAALDAKWLAELTAAERIAGFVVGLPVHTSGNESQKSAEARKFGKWVAEMTGLPVTLFDERYTSAQAEALLMDAELTRKRRKERLDKLAAQILLAAYLESDRSGEAADPIEG
jgi:putative holliday junction resolvase